MTDFDVDEGNGSAAAGATATLDIEQLAREYGARLYATALRILRNEDDARDAVQDGFVRAIRYAETFEGRSSVYTWLYRIVVNSALKMLKKRPPYSTESLDELLPRFDGRGCRIEPSWSRQEETEEVLLSKELRQSVRDAIQKLPDDYRVVVLLRDIDERSTQEAADLLGISPGAVKVRLHRARAALKTQIELLSAAAV